MKDWQGDEMKDVKFPTVPYDKALHFIYGAAIAVAVMYVFMLFGTHRPSAKGLGFAAACLIGVAKEGLDYVQNQRCKKAGLPEIHTVSGMDAAATAVGGLLVLIA